MRSLFTLALLGTFSALTLTRYCRFAPHFTIDMLINDQYARDEFISLYL